MKFLDAVVDSVPCYELGFLPDKSVVEFLGRMQLAGALLLWAAYERLREQRILRLLRMPQPICWRQDTVCVSGHGAKYATGHRRRRTDHGGAISADDVRIRDIVLYRAKQSVIAHRVEKIEREAERVTCLLLRGDASEDDCDDRACRHKC